MIITKDGFIFIRSPNKLKKYRVIMMDRYVDFGAIKKDGTPYSQFRDSIGLFSDYDNHDVARKNRYFKRHNKDYGKYSPDWFSKVYLWT
jgi:hypothetical protein